MTEATFDSLATGRALERAGMDAAHAEAVTEAISGAMGSADTVTRADLNAAMAALRAELAAMETRLTWRMLAIVGGLLALMTAFDRLLG